MPATPSPVRLFIGSSSEGLDVAHNLQAVLEERSVCEVEVWDQGVFAPGDFALESLLIAASRNDFAVLVASPDDVTMSRGDTGASVRDNIVLEFGLFLGALGRGRAYLMATGAAKLPTDTLGLTRLPYRPRDDGNLRAAVNAAALQIGQQVKTLGPRQAAEPGVRGATSTEAALLARELELLCANAQSQGWTVRTNSPTTLRLVPPGRRRPAHTLAKRSPRATRDQLRPFVAQLRAAGLRVNSALREPAEQSPL